ncbi:hypothetical protein [Nocardia phage NC1]|nr:hypothetical protein [Nocardia phage NC1]QSL67774.1 hypothetical protein [Nocardia phage P69]
MSGGPRPDFVIVGTHYQDGVIVLASDSLTEAELSFVMEEQGIVSAHGRTSHPRARHTLEVKFTDYRKATGRTYAEAMSNLFHQWHPHERDQRSIHSRMPKLPSDRLFIGTVK